MFKKIIFFIFLYFLFINSALAAGNLEVRFDPDPLFNNVVFAPGNEASVLIEIKNLSNDKKQVVTETENVIDPDNFASCLEINILNISNVLYKNNLNNFFAEDEVFLSDLDAGENIIFNFIINFKSECGNYWQGKSLQNFDLLIGFLGEEKIAVTKVLVMEEQIPGVCIQKKRKMRNQPATIRKQSVAIRAGEKLMDLLVRKNLHKNKMNLPAMVLTKVKTKAGVMARLRVKQF